MDFHLRSDDSLQVDSERFKAGGIQDLSNRRRGNLWEICGNPVSGDATVLVLNRARSKGKDIVFERTVFDASTTCVSTRDPPVEVGVIIKITVVVGNVYTVPAEPMDRVPNRGGGPSKELSISLVTIY